LQTQTILKETLAPIYAPLRTEVMASSAPALFPNWLPHIVTAGTVAQRFFINKKRWEII